MLQKLCDLGYFLQAAEVEAYAAGQVVSRVHFAKALAARGYVKDVEEAFETLIGNEGPAYIPRQCFTMEEGTAWLVQMGAKVSLAHPMLYHLTDEQCANERTGRGRRGGDPFPVSGRGEQTPDGIGR